MKKYPIFLLMFLGLAMAQAQVTFQKTYGAGVGYAVQQTLDGGYVIGSMAGGSTYSVSIVTKVDSAGVQQWSKSYRSGTVSLWTYSIEQTYDGGYILSGSNSAKDAVLLKVDAAGAVQWTRTFGGTRDDYACSARQTADSGYIVVGTINNYEVGTGVYDLYLIKTFPNGTVQWAKSFGGTGWEWGASVQQTSDGGFIAVGYTDSYGAGNKDVYLVKTAADGTLQWEKTFGGPHVEYGESVQQTKDGGYIITGVTASFGAGEEDVYLVKTDPDGNLKWTKTFGGEATDWANSVQQTKDGGFVMVGQTSPVKGGGVQAYLLKADSIGDLQWSRSYAGAMSNEIGHSVLQAKDGGYLLSGSTVSFALSKGSYIYVIKTDSTGKSGCYDLTPLTAQGSGGVQGTGGGSEGQVGSTGSPFTQVNSGGTEANVCFPVGINELKTAVSSVSAFPNPFSAQTTLYTEQFLHNATLTVCDCFGRPVAQQSNISGQSISFDRDQLSSGVYFIQVTEESKVVATGKLVIADH